MTLSFTLSDEEKSFLCRQAAMAIETGLNGARTAAPKEPESAQSILNRDLGCFVTITISGNLRGCIGTIIAHEPLWLNAWNMARAAAFNDPRFPSLSSREWARSAFEISVLDQPSPCPDPEKIEIGRDGLILQYKGQSGVFLPQVPVEQGWNLGEYLDHLCLKAGVPAGSWQQPGAQLFWYQALVFHC